jgi:hypothetical protein
MPFSINGCGTRYYGKRDKLQDGSYITTEWITLFFIPIIPLRSFRVRSVSKQSTWALIASAKDEKFMVARVPLNWKQVFKGYIALGVIITIYIIIFVLHWLGVNNF